MNKWFQKMLGVNLPTAEEYIKSQIDVAQKKNELQANDPESAVASLGLVLLRNGQVVVECEWLENNTDLAKSYGQFLYHVNTGSCQETIANTLTDYAHNNICTSDFIRTIMDSWNDTILEKSEEPVIPASSVIGMGRQQ